MNVNKLLTVSEDDRCGVRVGFPFFPLPLLTIRAMFAAVHPRSVLRLKV